MTREETAPGQVMCFGSDEDSGCDVGTSIGLGDGKVLWIGELLTRDGANMGFVFHGPDRERVVAPFADGTDWQEIADLFRHYVAPAIAKIADAEAAAMRERAAGVANDAAEAARPYANGVGLGPATERHRMLEAERIAAAIRALPGRGSERQRYITTWRKRPPESVLDWDHYVSEDDAELEGVIKNLKAQGVKQWNTFRLGERVASQSSEH